MAALLATIDTKNAVRIPLGDTPERLIMALHKAASRANVRFRYRRERTALVGWVERPREKTA